GLRAATSLAGQDYEAGQVVALAAQAVGHPGAEAGPAGKRRARVHHHVRWVVVDLVRVHRPDDADVVCNAAGVRQEVGDELTVAAVAAEGDLRPEAAQLLALKLGDGLATGER